ncbi:unnamed protein product [Lampetra fluviatilis]
MEHLPSSIAEPERRSHRERMVEPRIDSTVEAASILRDVVHLLKVDKMREYNANAHETKGNGSSDDAAEQAHANSRCKYGCSLCKFFTYDEKIIKEHMTGENHRRTLRVVDTLFPNDKHISHFLHKKIEYRNSKIVPMTRKRWEEDNSRPFNELIDGITLPEGWIRTEVVRCLACRRFLLRDKLELRRHIASSVHAACYQTFTNDKKKGIQSMVFQVYDSATMAHRFQRFKRGEDVFDEGEMNVKKDNSKLKKEDPKAKKDANKKSAPAGAAAEIKVVAIKGKTDLEKSAKKNPTEHKESADGVKVKTDAEGKREGETEAVKDDKEKGATSETKGKEEGAAAKEEEEETQGEEDDLGDDSDLFQELMDEDEGEGGEDEEAAAESAEVAKGTKETGQEKQPPEGGATEHSDELGDKEDLDYEEAEEEDVEAEEEEDEHEFEEDEEDVEEEMEEDEEGGEEEEDEGMGGDKEDFLEGLLDEQAEFTQCHGLNPVALTHGLQIP